MKKGNKKAVIVLSILCLTLTATLVAVSKRYLQDKDAKDKKITSLQRQLKGAESEEQRLHRQAFQELLLQYSGYNLLYSTDLKRPIRAVSEDNWNLMEEGFLFNFTNEEIHKDTLKLSPCFVEEDSILAFYYMPTDSCFTLNKTPPEKGWFYLESTAKGNYILPLKDIEESNGCKFIAFKYLLTDKKFYYGLIAFK